MDIKPIRSEVDYEAALKEIDQLLESQAGTPEADRLELLVTLVEAYEARQFPITTPDDPVEVLSYYMESRGLSRADLIPYLGSKERVSEVLNQKRSLSLAMIRRLHTGLGIPTDLLIGKSNTRARKAPLKQTKTQAEP